MKSLRYVKHLCARIAVVVLAGLSFATLARAQENIDATTTQSLSGNSVPTRVTETRREVDGRTIVTRVTEAPSINGGYAPINVTEEETIRENDNTVRVIQRSFIPDSNGHRQLSQETVTDATELPGGKQKTIRTTSLPDLDGHLQTLRREVEESTPIDASTTQTTTTVFQSMGDRLAPVQQTRQIERREGDVTHVQRTQRAVDVNGNFLTTQVTQSAEKGAPDGTRTKEERVLAGDPGKVGADADLIPSQTTFTKQWKDADGREHSSTQTYSTVIPGVTSDGRLRLDRESTTVRRVMPDGTEQVIQQVEQTNPGNPSDGPQPAEKVIEISRPGVEGKTQTIKTVDSATGNGGMKPVWVSDSQGSKKIP